MKNIVKLLGIIVSLMVIGFVFLACTKTYTVAFNSNDGSSVAPITTIKVKSGNTVTMPENPGPGTIGYNRLFSGWYDESLNHVYNFNTPVVGDLTLYAKREPYELGDNGPGGGIIFYRSETGFTMADDNSIVHYLEAAPVDQGINLTWSSSEFTSSNISGTEKNIGSGRLNASLILTVDANAPAAKACNDFSNNGLNDWFLPSIDELNQLYKNRVRVGNFNTSFDHGHYYYWSSSQYNNNNAMDQRFLNNDESAMFNDPKSNRQSVRAIRAF